MGVKRHLPEAANIPDTECQLLPLIERGTKERESNLLSSRFLCHASKIKLSWCIFTSPNPTLQAT